MLSLFLLTLAANQAAPVAVAPVAAAPVEAAKPKLICKRSEETGSRLGGKTCLTREQWAARRKAEAGEEGAGEGAERQGGSTQAN